MEILLAIGASVAILLVVLGLWLPQTTPDPVRARLANFAERPKTLNELEFETPFAERVLRPMVFHASRVVRRFLPKGKGRAGEEPSLSGLQKRIVLAGNPSNLTANEFLGILGICTVGIGSLIAILMAMAGADLATAVLLGLVGGAIGYMVPSLWLSQKVRARQDGIRKALPDALDMLVICVEAGLGFDGAMQRVADKADNLLAVEFGRVIAEMQLGRPRREALKELIVRTEVPDLNSFVSAIVQGEQLGVSVSRVLVVQAEQMRMLRRQRAEELAAKAPLKMLFPMVFLIFPALFVVLLGPAVPDLFGGGLF